MPDKRKHRGKHPDDDRLFAEPQHLVLRTAVAEYSWLLTREYARDSALKLVGDHHGLTARQRLAVMRSSCSDDSLRERTAKLTALGKCRGGSIGIDGYNLLITVESALSGGLILIGRDGCYRDLASVHGTYRKVEETQPAVELIADYLAAFDIPRIDWYLDRPVSNSGRLKAFMAEVLEARVLRHPQAATWNIELINSPDAQLCDSTGTTVTSDGIVLDRCGAWVNLAKEIVDAKAPDAWIVDLRLPKEPGSAAVGES